MQTQPATQAAADACRATATMQRPLELQADDAEVVVLEAEVDTVLRLRAELLLPLPWARIQPASPRQLLRPVQLAAIQPSRMFLL